ncbi:MAG: hypothetical protein KDA89_24310, partial [Planctomycetaceae bacterium]|nr:hypothetical protein [Planctomycetaceae bacterium]
QRLGQLLTHPVFLRRSETRYAAANLLQQRFESWNAELRERIEAAIMQVGRDLQHFAENSIEAAEKLRDSLIACLPERAIVTVEAKALSERIRSSQAATPPRSASGIVNSGFISEEEYLRQKGKLQTENEKRLFELRQEIRRLGEPDQPLTANDIPQVFQKISECENALAKKTMDSETGDESNNAVGEIAALFSRLADIEGLSSADQLTISERLLDFANHFEPSSHIEIGDEWDKPHPGWSGFLPRIEAAWGIMNVVRHIAVFGNDIRTAIDRLADDASPPVRCAVIENSHYLLRPDPDFFWEVIERRVEAEDRLALLEDVVNILGGFSPKNQHADRIDRLIRRVETRIEGRENAGFVRKAMVVHHLRRSVYLGDRPADIWLEAIVDSPFDQSEELHELLRLWEKMLSQPMSTEVFTADELVSRGIDILARAFDASYTLWDGKPWEGMEHDEGRPVYHRATGPMQRIVRTTSLLLDGLSHPKKPAKRKDHRRIAQMVSTFRPLIEKCATVPLPSEAYDFLRTLQYISPVVPRDTLLWICSLVRSASEHGFLDDYMGADLLIKVLERYLVEHRDLLISDAAVREAMTLLLNECVRRHWPKSGPLLVRLHEAFRA